MAVFILDSPSVDLTVVNPAGRPVGRGRLQHIDRNNTEYATIRYRYEARPGRYRFMVTGRDRSEYTLEGLAAVADSSRLELSVPGTVGTNERHDCVAIIPESVDDQGTLERVDANLLPCAAGKPFLGAAGAGGAIYAYRRRRRQNDG